ncbi:MAG: DUF1499 domain-containing protein [bacterium]
MWKSLLAGLINNDVTAGDSWFYPDIEPVIIEGNRREAFQTIKQTFEELGDNWILGSTSLNKLFLEGAVETPTLNFRDDFTVVLEPLNDEEQKWKVIARSRSRIGLGDFGKNAENLRTFYAKLRDLSSTD